jgi:hypothetical protein
MFSNLRTEGALGNHLFVPASLKVFDFQDDLVQVLRASEEPLNDLAEERLLIPYLEFSRKVHAVTDPLSIEYLRGGELHRLEGAPPGRRPGIEPTPWLLGKLLRFRPIDAEGPNRCRW